MVNPYLGEVDIVIGDKSYILRPSFAVLCAIEEKLGKSIYLLLKEYPAKGLTMFELCEIILSANPDIARKSLEEEICQHYLKISEIVVRFLLGGVGV